MTKLPMVKKILKSSLVLVVMINLFSTLLIASPVKAVDWWQTAQQGGIGTIGQQAYGQAGEPTDIRLIVAQVIKVFLGLLGIIFLFLLVLAGYKYMTSRGNEEETKKAMDQILTAIIGLLIILAAYAITLFITNSLVTATR